LIAEHGELKAGTVVGARGRSELEGVGGAEEVALDVAEVIGEDRLEDGHVEGLDELVARVADVGLAGDAWILGVVGVGGVDVVAIEAESDIYIKSVRQYMFRVCYFISNLPGASTSAEAVSIRWITLGLSMACLMTKTKNMVKMKMKKIWKTMRQVSAQTGSPDLTER
jgi:hypothetical protein